MKMKKCVASFLATSLVPLVLYSFNSRAKAVDTTCDIPSIVTEDIFEQFAYNLQAVACEGNGFYTYRAFLAAAPLFHGFLTSDLPSCKRELAAFFAHVAELTSGLCNVSQILPPHQYCNPNISWPCVPGKSYFGRGPLQISWNYNYGPAGESIGFDGLNNPEAVATDAIVSFKSAIWFWMNSLAKEDFAQTRAVVKGDTKCVKGSFGEATTRYQEYCQILSVDPGSSLHC